MMVSLMWRQSGQVAGQTVAHPYDAMRSYVNYFQPSFKLMEKMRNCSAAINRRGPPVTPCDREFRHQEVRAETRAALAKRKTILDPVALLDAIR